MSKKRSLRDFDADNYVLYKRQKRSTKNTFAGHIRSGLHTIDRPDVNTMVMEDRDFHRQLLRYDAFERASRKAFIDTGELQPYVSWNRWKSEIDKWPIKTLTRASPINNASSQIWSNVLAKGHELKLLHDPVTDNYDIDFKKLPKLSADVLSHIRGFLT